MVAFSHHGIVKQTWDRSSPASVRQDSDRCSSRAGWKLGQPMNRHESKVFENQHVILDEGVFVNCTFKNCSLEYSGGDVYVQNCQGEGCQLVWRGAAQRTVLLLQGLGMMVAPPAPAGSEPASRVQ